MAEGRMLKKNISCSKKLAKLKSDSSRMLYCFIMPHVDIEGRYSADPEIIKGHILPKLKRWSEKKIEINLGELDEIELIILYSIDGEPYLQYVDFKKYQTLRPDKEAESKIPAPLLDKGRSGTGVVRGKVEVEVEGKVKDKVELERVETPQYKTKKFFEAIKGNTKEFQDLILALAERNKTEVQLIEREIIRFTYYWTELSHSGRKERWELQPTFEINRRLATWFGNIDKFSGFSTQIKGRKIV